MNVMSRGSGAVIRAQRRFRARRRRQSRRLKLRLVFAALAGGAVVAGGWLLANSSLFALRYVTVEGISRLNAAQVLDAAAVRQGASLVRLDPGAVAARVERLAPVRTAHVTRNWPHGLVIRVVERTPAAVVVGPGGDELLDESGVAFATVSTPPPALIHVTVTGDVPGSGTAATRAAMQVLAELPGGLRHRVTSIDAPSADAVSVTLRNAHKVVWGSPLDAAAKATVLHTLMAHHPARVYDVSTPTIAVTRD